MTKKYQLPKEFAQKWVLALRSGNYGQSIGELKKKNENKYCCLGVACHINNVKKIVGKGWIGYDVSNQAKPNKKIPQLLVGDSNENKFVAKVAAMNDGGKSFSEIADWIEANVEFVTA